MQCIHSHPRNQTFLGSSLISVLPPLCSLQLSSHHLITMFFFFFVLLLPLTLSVSPCPCVCRRGPRALSTAISECRSPFTPSFCTPSSCLPSVHSLTRGHQCCDAPVSMPSPSIPDPFSCPCVCRTGPSADRVASNECASGMMMGCKKMRCKGAKGVMCCVEKKKKVDCECKCRRGRRGWERAVKECRGKGMCKMVKCGRKGWKCCQGKCEQGEC